MYIDGVKKFSVYLMSAIYVLAGINHFLNPALYMSIMPRWLPWHYTLVIVSGVFEIVLGLLLLPLKTRRLAAYGIIFLLIAVFPANIQMMLDYFAQNKPGAWITILRLPLQVVLIWWAWKVGVKSQK